MDDIYNVDEAIDFKMLPPSPRLSEEKRQTMWDESREILKRGTKPVFEKGAKHLGP